MYSTAVTALWERVAYMPAAPSGASALNITDMRTTRPHDRVSEKKVEQSLKVSLYYDDM